MRTLLLLMNAYHEDVEFKFRRATADKDWRTLLDSAWDDLHQQSLLTAQGSYPLKARSLAMLVEHRRSDRIPES